MIRHIACAAAALTVAAAVSGCDSAPPPQANARQVTVVGTGEVQGTPDTVTADVGIEVVAPDVTTAMNQTNQRQQAVIDATYELGAPGMAAQWSVEGIALPPAPPSGTRTITVTVRVL